jgi:hypothetical protein
MPPKVGPAATAASKKVESEQDIFAMMMSSGDKPLSPVALPVGWGGAGSQPDPMRMPSVAPSSFLGPGKTMAKVKSRAKAGAVASAAPFPPENDPFASFSFGGSGANQQQQQAHADPFALLSARAPSPVGSDPFGISAAVPARPANNAADPFDMFSGLSQKPPEAKPKPNSNGFGAFDAWK